MKNKKLDKTIGWTYTFLIALFVKTLTKVDTLGAAFSYFGSMFGAHGNSFTSDTFIFLIKEYWIYLIVGTLISFPVIKILKEKIMSSNKRWLKISAQVVSCVFIVCVLILSYSFMSRNGSTSFLYQQF